MSLHLSIITWLLLAVSMCLAEKRSTRATSSSSVTLQPWLVGLSAVLGFLFLIFVILLVKRIFFDNSKEDDDGDYAELESGQENIQTTL